jgi:hypothetical protein
MDDAVGFGGVSVGFGDGDDMAWFSGEGSSGGFSYYEDEGDGLGSDDPDSMLSFGGPPEEGGDAVGFMGGDMGWSADDGFDWTEGL